jgi:hypothetical protein
VKKTDLEKSIGMKISGKMKQAGAPERYGKQADVAAGRRAQRKLDQALGLVPFAVKLDGDLVKRIQALAQARQAGLNEVVVELLERGLAA